MIEMSITVDQGFEFLVQAYVTFIKLLRPNAVSCGTCEFHSGEETVYRRGFECLWL